MFEKIWIYHCGYCLAPSSWVMPGEPTHRVKLPFMALAALHPEHGLVLVDAPYGHDGPRNVGALLGALLRATAVRFEDDWSVIPRIEQLGHRPSQVEHVLMTHLHYDHTGGMKELGHATFHVARREWNAATTARPFEALTQGYAVSDFRALNAHVAPFSSPERYDRADPGVDLLGDGSVRAIALPGHAVGHTGYLFTMRDGAQLFYVGDAAFDLRQITERAQLGPFPRRVAHKLAETQFTLSELQRFHEERPEVRLLCAHDVRLGASCMEGPNLLWRCDRGRVAA